MKNFFALLIFLAAFGALKAQDINFSQFYNLPLMRNPALAGVFDGDLRMNAVFRNQWQSISVPFQSGAASVEYKLPLAWGDWVTLGLQATHDVAGDIKLKRTQLLPVINYHKSLSENEDDFISLAFMGGPVQSQFDPNNLKMDDQYQNGVVNPGATSQTFQRTSYSYWDASVGLSFSSGFGEDSRYYLGAALYHFNKPKTASFASDNFSVVEPRIVFNGGLNIPVSETDRLSFFTDYFKQSGHQMVMGGLFYEIQLSGDYDSEETSEIGFGAMYRWNDAVIPAIKLSWNRLTAGISYDVNVSQLKTVSQMKGGFEFTLSYRAKLINRSYYSRMVTCPR